METKLTKLTPKIARDLLKLNTANRPLQASKVNALMASFQRGEYIPSHQGIAISTERVLLDGQHRLHAIAGMPDSFEIHMLATTGLPPEAFDVIDTMATPRSAADVLRISRGLSAVARFVVRLIDTSNNQSVTPAYMRPFADAIEPYYADLLDYCPTVSKTWAASSIRTAAILRMIGGGNRDYVLLSYHALNHADYDAMSPIVQALNKQRARGTFNSQSLDIFVRAFRAFDARKQHIPTIQISDQSHLLGEARYIVSAHILGEKKAPTSGAKKVNDAKSTPARTPIGVN